MALYHLSVKTISRRTGRSATGAAAYRAGVRITDERTGLVHDYRRRGGVVHRELFTPAEAPAWAQDRAALWNAAEQAERRQDATVAREVEIALPHELNPAQRLALARAFSQALSERHGMAVDLTIHAPHRGDPRNQHAHLLCSTRRLAANGFTEKTREWENRQPAKGLTGQQVVVHWRQTWEQQANQALERAGYEPRLDHRSLQVQGLERVPQIHHGPKVAALERRGIRTERGDHVRAIDHHNAQLIDLNARRRDLELQLNAGEARAQFRALWEQHQAEQARQQPVQELAEPAAAEWRRQVDRQREAEQAREREPVSRLKPERELEHELEHAPKRERSGPELDR
jgi:ATP-dependent exoDNAse (exonuclease V) alpha subunit